MTALGLAVVVDVVAGAAQLVELPDEVAVVEQEQLLEREGPAEVLLEVTRARCADVEDEVDAELRSVCLGLPEAFEEQAWAGTRWQLAFER